MSYRSRKNSSIKKALNERTTLIGKPGFEAFSYIKEEIQYLTTMCTANTGKLEQLLYELLGDSFDVDAQMELGQVFVYDATSSSDPIATLEFGLKDGELAYVFEMNYKYVHTYTFQNRTGVYKIAEEAAKAILDSQK